MGVHLLRNLVKTAEKIGCNPFEVWADPSNLMYFLPLFCNIFAHLWDSRKAGFLSWHGGFLVSMERYEHILCVNVKKYSLHTVRPTTADLSWSRISHRLVNELRCLGCFQQVHLEGYLLQEFLLLIFWAKANVEMVCFVSSSLILVLYEPVSNWLTFRYLSMLPRRFERKKNDLKIIFWRRVNSPDPRCLCTIKDDLLSNFAG